MTAQVSVFLSSLIVLNIFTNLFAGDCTGLHLLGHVLLNGSTRLAHLVFVSIILLFCLSLLLSFLWFSICWRTLCFTQGASWYPYPGWPTPGKWTSLAKYLPKSMQFPAGISIVLLVWLSCRVSYINNISGYNSMYIIIGYDINTPLMTMYEIMTLCKHRMT